MSRIKTVMGLVLIGAGSVIAIVGLLGLAIIAIDPTGGSFANDSNPMERPAPWFSFLLPLVIGLVLGVLGAKMFTAERSKESAEQQPRP